MTTEQKKTYTDSAICDLIKDFIKSYKVDGIHKYWELISGIKGNYSPIEFDYDELSDELQRIISIYHKNVFHSCLYRAIKEILQIDIGSAVDGLVRENKIKFTITNYDRYSGVLFEKPKKKIETYEIKLNKDDDEKVSATMRVYNVGKTIIENKIKSENDTRQIVIKVKLDDKPHWIDMFSPTFEEMIRVKLQNTYDEIYTDSTYKSGIKNLHANASLNGSVLKPVFSRSALVDDELFYDLQNMDGTVYKISKDGISKVVDYVNSPIFLKSPSANTTKNMQAEPSFDNNNALDEFVNLCRIQQQDKVVFVSHLISFFLSGFPIPIKIIHGEQGSAKSAISSAIKSLVDPEGENKQSLPESIDNLALMLSNRDITNFDNIENFTKEISQFLCKAITGTLYSKRSLYTNNTEFSLVLKSKIILNGIDPTINQPDLLERSIFYELPKIEKTQRMTDKKFDDKIDELRPSVLGIIFQTIQKAMTIIHDVEKELDGVSLPRMASFAIWGEAISRALGNSDNLFISRYWEMINDSNLSLNEEYPLIPKIIDMMKRNCKLDEKQQPIQLVKTVSLKELFDDLIGNDNKDKGLPIDTKVLGKQLKQLTPILRTMGYETTVVKYNKKDGKYPRGSRIVTFTPISEKGLEAF